MTVLSNSGRLASSFRDPSGFVFVEEGTLYRQVNQSYRDEYDTLMDSGLYERLAERSLLVRHKEADLKLARTADAYQVIQPEAVPFIAYPYEWCFGQWKAAALAMLQIQSMALECGLSLKDSSAYNIQFVDGRPVLIDTLSFERYQEGAPWVAYRQFCQHFLAPLALMSYTDVRLGQLMRVYLDGIPLDLASRLLPRTSYLRLPLLLHIHLHARAQARYKGQGARPQSARRPMSKQALLGLVDNLKSGVQGLQWRGGKTAWMDYYEDDSYTPAAFAHKQQVVQGWLATIRPETVWDLGANTGVFSRLASSQGSFTVAWDFDPGAVELNYREVQKTGDRKLLPLVLDLTNPSPAIGWENRERLSFGERGPVDCIMALALIHHLAIANNLPLEMIAAALADKCRRLIVEFVPKEDAKVQVLLATRKDIFPHYTQEGFEAAFGPYFSIQQREAVQDSARVLYWMETR